MSAALNHALSIEKMFTSSEPEKVMVSIGELALSEHVWEPQDSVVIPLTSRAAKSFDWAITSFFIVVKSRFSTSTILVVSLTEADVPALPFSTINSLP